ncbi:MAG: cbb3-type cytochrome c oxidase subunit I [Bacteroidetes bacterium]|nr:cbb3-type cytochrome c oxidase subunit I [Bacteroidota bacterium]
MEKRNFLNYLLNPRNWWLPLLVIFIVSVSGVTYIGMHTYSDAPPLPEFKHGDRTVFTKQDILKGQALFQQHALMEYGSMFGDGALRGPDFTADALHVIMKNMQSFYLNQSPNDSLSALAITARVQHELRRNNYTTRTNRVELSPAQAFAADRLVSHYVRCFQDPGYSGHFKSIHSVHDSAEIRNLTAFFFWGAWVCVSARPGKTYSYTHNWPFDPEAGNTPSPAIILWSILGSLGLILALGIVMYYHGKLDKLKPETYTRNAGTMMNVEMVSQWRPNPVQKATYKYFLTAMLLFGLQVLSGILTVHDFVGLVNWFGFHIDRVLPITISRSWHVQLSVLWISACWIGGSFFIMGMVNPRQPHAQVQWINRLFLIIVLLVAGSVFGIWAGPSGLLPTLWYWFGHSGWEFLEPGRVWQIVLGVVFIIWARTLFVGLKPVFQLKKPWELPNWLIYSNVTIILLLISGYIITPETNFVIADFWRWMVVHMWAEAFFEVFTTVLIGYFMVMMGLVSRPAAIRVIYLAVLLFLGSGLLGISHNFYWNAKPVFTMALGSVFSTLQVVPLILLTLEAWRFSKLPAAIENAAPKEKKIKFGFPGVFLFLLAVNFWNFFGAGVLGFIINLPIANYYEHGTYLTVNHGHAALMGVYGNLALAIVLFCSQLMIQSDHWRPKQIKLIFWSINAGLMLMVLMDLLPAGIWQFDVVAEKGLWYARSHAFVESENFQILTWMRIAGGALFTLGGVYPLCRLLLTGSRNLKDFIR